MKSLAAIFVGPIQNIEISLGAAFYFDDFWNIMNTLFQAENREIFKNSQLQTNFTASFEKKRVRQENADKRAFHEDF